MKSKIILLIVHREANDYNPEHYILSHDEQGIKKANLIFSRYHTRYFTKDGYKKFLLTDVSKMIHYEVMGRDYMGEKVWFRLLVKEVNKI